MKIRLTESCDTIKEVEFAQSEFNEFNRVVEVLDSYFQSEQLLHILIGNYNDYFITISSMTQNIFNDGDIRKNLLRNITSVNWKLLNLSASFKCYIDQILGSDSYKRVGLFDNKLFSDIHKNIKEKYNSEKENDDAKYLYCFRNDIQHNFFPIKGIGFSREVVGKDEQKTRLITLAYREQPFGKEYLKIGNGIQSLFDIHYDIIRKEILPIFEEYKVKYKDFFNKYTSGNSTVLLEIVDKGTVINSPVFDYPERIDDFINQNFCTIKSFKSI
jgi:hypothetical protein